MAVSRASIADLIKAHRIQVESDRKKFEIEDRIITFEDAKLLADYFQETQSKQAFKAPEAQAIERLVFNKCVFNDMVPLIKSLKSLSALANIKFYRCDFKNISLNDFDRLSEISTLKVLTITACNNFSDEEVDKFLKDFQQRLNLSKPKTSTPTPMWQEKKLIRPTDYGTYDLGLGNIKISPFKRSY